MAGSWWPNGWNAKIAPVDKTAERKRLAASLVASAESPLERELEFRRTLDPDAPGMDPIAQKGLPPSVRNIVTSLLTLPQRSFDAAQEFSTAFNEGRDVSPEAAGTAFEVGGTLAGGGLARQAIKGPAATAGELGIFGGRLAKNAPVDELIKAQALEEAGKSADDIWRATGWGRGADGEWRFEIDDSGTKFAIPVKDWVSRSEGGTLMAPTVGTAYRKAADNLVPQAPMRVKRIMEHGKAEEAYPGAMDTELMLQRNVGGGRGSYSGDLDEGGMMTLNEALQPQDAKSVLLHELQHVIQNKEGFARGGNTVSVFGHSDPVVRKAVTQEMNKLLRTMPREEYAAELRKTWPEATEADVSESYKGYLRANKEAKSSVYHPANKAAQETAATTVYRNMAGEVESRNVQKRMNMSAEERRATPPWTTEDVPRDQQIVRRGR